MASVKDTILKWAQAHTSFKSPALVKYLGISRQNVAGHLAALVQAGSLTKEGSTRNATYHLPQGKAKTKKPETKTLILVKKLKGLEEHVVFEEVSRKLSLSSQLNARALTIVNYAFTEMLNNAIDHSRSRTARVWFSVTAHSLHFSVRDFGIGAYRNVQQCFKLKSEFEALEHLFKGKQTTDPERHSGEGIFFTSRVADKFQLRSHRLNALVDNEAQDRFVREDRPLRGTLVEFQIRRRTKKTLEQVFQQFTGRDYQFEKNRISVKLTQEGSLLSRSQAKRLLSGLESYREIIFDFRGVKGIGQGFADEIFRVFKNRHPEINLGFENAVPVVNLMIRRVGSKP